MSHDLPEGFQRISGERPPPNRDARYFIHLRCGFTDTRISYSADQLNWKHGKHSGDVIAVKLAEGQTK